MQELSEDEANRRGHSRQRRVCLAWVEVVTTPATYRGIAQTVDLSSRGVGLVLSAPIKPGTAVQVDLTTPGSLRLRASGRVVHSRPLDGGRSRVGVNFDSPPRLVDGDSISGDHSSKE